MDSTVYDSSYYLTGKQSGKSLYENYRWLPDLTLPMCQRIVEHLGIEKSDSLLDFGCARGYVVKALRHLGYCAFGYDPSEWAIWNADDEVAFYVSGNQTLWQCRDYDWILAKDVLEHIPDAELTAVIDSLTQNARKGVFVVVPLSPAPGLPYVVPEYEQDVTHVQRLDMAGWLELLTRDGFETTGKYLVQGIKQNYSQFHEGNGFITLRRK